MRSGMIGFLGATTGGPDPLQLLIQAIYSGGRNGAFYVPVPTVLGRQVLFQDAAGTIPVASDGDPVGLILDISGNENHAVQTSSANRMTYRTDGTLHWLHGSGSHYFAHNVALSDTSTIVAAAEREAGGTTSPQGLFTVTAPNSPIKSNLCLKSASTTAWGTYAGAWRSSGVNLLGSRSVVTLTASGGSIASNVQTMYTNSALSAQFTGGFSGDALDRRYIFSEHTDGLGRAGYGKFFGGVAVDVVLPEAVRNDAENYFAGLSGI